MSIRLRSVSSLSLALALCLGGSALAAPGVTLSRGDLLRFETGEQAVSARAGVVGYGGEGVSLTWRKSGLKGRYLGREVDLAARGASVDGRIGELPVAVKLSHGVVERGLALALEGRVGDGAVSLRVTPMYLRGVLAECTYSLGLAGQAYRGWRDCAAGGPPQPVELELPRVAGRDDDASLAALLLVTLAPRGPAAPPLPAAGRDELLEDRYGFAVGDVEPRDAGPGARVLRVIDGSQADRAGLVAGMIIERAGSERVMSASALEAALAKLAPGQRLVLGVKWPGKRTPTRLELAAPPLRW